LIRIADQRNTGRKIGIKAAATSTTNEIGSNSVTFSGTFLRFV